LELDRIETPENVELQRRIAGIGTRFLAGLIDTLWLTLIWIVLIIVVFTSGLISASMFSPETILDSGVWMLALLFIVFFVIYWGYFAFFELWTNGQSPGKKCMKIRVVTVEGSAVSFASVAIRSLLRIIDVMPFGYALGGLVMFLTKRGQRLGDLAAGTVVISEAVPDYSVKGGRRTAEMAPASVKVNDETCRTAGMTSEQYRALKNYMARRHQFPLDVRQRLLLKLLTPVLSRLRVTLPDMTVARMETFVKQRLFSAHLRTASPSQGNPLDALLEAQGLRASEEDRAEDAP